ncbi:MAG: SusC/RagA family TonB-linked outer membrane protein, partial [Bacteroidales bacterium]|nr:SusC/RagA family TonB-linked outer membrane protein [Bacteroidales bacterium]
MTAFLMCMLFCSVQLYAQVGGVVRGKVTLKQDGSPLIGVTVYEKSADNRIESGVVTDDNGNYQIMMVNKKDTLYFSQLGLKTVAMAVGTREVINVPMVDVTILGEVSVEGKRGVSSGGFLNIDPRNSTAAISSVDLKGLEEIPATSLDQILEGQVSGLLISMNSGDPGSGSAIQIRGAASLGLGSKPLIVVDDVPFKTSAEVDVNSPEGLSELVNLSPSDIASIDILKDAAATSLYGSDGANGVIVIKTKRGDNIKPRVNISSTLTLKQPQSSLPLLNGDQYKTMILEEYQHYKGPNQDLTSSPIRNLYLEKGDVDYENYNNNTYWPDEINMKMGYGRQFSGSIIGGGESAKYNISLSYTDEAGPTIKTKFTRATGRFNFDYKISDRLFFNSDFAYTSAVKNSNYGNNLGQISLTKAPVMPVYTQDEYGNSLSSYYFPDRFGYQRDVRNPVAVANLADANNVSDKLDAKIYMRWNALKNVNVNSLFSTSYESAESNQALPHSANGVDFYRENNYYLVTDPGGVNQSTESPYNAFGIYFKNDAVYKYQKGKHVFNTGFYTIYSDDINKYMGFSAYNLPFEDITIPSSSDNISSMSSRKEIRRKFSMAGQLYYLYGDRYCATVSVRRQGDSSFGKNNRFGTFPAISGFWRPTSEPFLKDAARFMELKIRGSYGITGRSPEKDVAAKNIFTYSSNAPYIDLQGITADNIELKNLKWERKTELNLGVELSILKGRMTTVAEFNNSTTRDLILDAPIPYSSGFELMTQNFGTLKGKGYELTLTGVPIKTKTWNLIASFNISSSNNKVTALPNGDPVVKKNVLSNGNYLSLVNVGDQIGTIYGLKYLGVYAYDADAFVKDAAGNFITDLSGEKVPVRWMTSTGAAFTGGDAIYADMNSDGVINKQDVRAIGNVTPDFYGGFNFRLKYKQSWEFFANFTFQSGFEIINDAKMRTTNMYSNNNQTQAVMRRWRKQGDVTDMPRALYGTGNNWVGSDRYVEDGSYIKCNTLSLS